MKRACRGSQPTNPWMIPIRPPESYFNNCIITVQGGNYLFMGIIIITIPTNLQERWQSQPIRSLRYLVTCTRIRDLNSIPKNIEVNRGVQEAVQKYQSSEVPNVNNTVQYLCILHAWGIVLNVFRRRRQSSTWLASRYIHVWMTFIKHLAAPGAIIHPG